MSRFTIAIVDDSDIGQRAVQMYKQERATLSKDAARTFVVGHFKDYEQEVAEAAIKEYEVSK